MKRKHAANRLLKRATNIESALNRMVRWEDAAEAFIDAFQEVLNLKFESAELTPGELARVEELVKQKYTNPLWTERI